MSRKLIPLLLLAFSACSTEPLTSDRFQTLDYDSKIVFLTYYPYLTRDQKDEFLASEDKSPREMIQSWSGQFDDPYHQVGSFDEMMNNPINRKIKTLEIKLDTPEPITQGNKTTARAFATYENGRTVEVTQDTEWKVEPRLAQFEKNVLSFDCVHSDLTINANFLNEKEASKPLEIRKPIASLEVKIADGYIGADTGYNFQLSLTAHCKDGSTSDVSCQGLWKSVATGGKIEGCGNFVVTSKEKLDQDALTVIARYGDRSVRKTLRAPIR